MTLTIVVAKPLRKPSGSRPAALRSGIHSGESRSEVGQSRDDTQTPRANLAFIPASAGALPASDATTPTQVAPEAHHSAPSGGGSANGLAKPNHELPIPSFPLRRGSSASMSEILSFRTPTSIHPAQAGQTESAIKRATPKGGSRSPSPHSA